MRIFIGPTEVAGIAVSLRDGFQEIGVEAGVVLNRSHPFVYSGQRQENWLLRIWTRLCVLNSTTLRKHIFRKTVLALSYRIAGLAVLLWSLWRFDAFVFVFGQTITNTRFELWLMKVLRRRIVFLYLGSDARPPFINGASFWEHPVDLLRLKSITEKLKRRLRFQEKYADVCINSPSSAQFHGKPFINWFAIGLPRKIAAEARQEINQRAEKEVRILHSPSHPLAKGTPAIQKAIDSLIAKGHSIDFVKIEGMPNSMIVDELTRCDFIADQLYSDTPMAAFAVEAAHFGKPAVVGGYFAPVIGDYLREEQIPPSLFVQPDEIEQAIEKLVVDVEHRRELGRRAQMFVRTQWAPEEVARRFLRLIKKDIPHDWWCDPQEIRYVYGGGISDVHAREVVRGLIERFGTPSLQLEDKPELEKAFLKFAGLHRNTQAPNAQSLLA